MALRAYAVHRPLRNFQSCARAHSCLETAGQKATARRRPVMFEVCVVCCVCTKYVWLSVRVSASKCCCKLKYVLLQERVVARTYCREYEALKPCDCEVSVYSGLFPVKSRRDSSLRYLELEMLLMASCIVMFVFPNNVYLVCENLGQLHMRWRAVS